MSTNIAFYFDGRSNERTPQTLRYASSRINDVIYVMNEKARTGTLFVSFSDRGTHDYIFGKALKSNANKYGSLDYSSYIRVNDVNIIHKSEMF